MNTDLAGVTMRSLKKFTDARGWLMEVFRDDELPEGFKPSMGYLSITHPGVSRGPHEHVHQSDLFIFMNGSYELHLWENREGRPERYEVHAFGEENPTFVIVPPGVVHAYRNVGTSDAFVLNFPNQLYAGRGKKDPVDEIRHEDIDSRFKI